MEIAKLIPDYLRAILSWPLLTAFLIWIFSRELRLLLHRLIDLIEQIKKVNVSGLSVELIDRLQSESVSKISEHDSQTRKALELSASTGGHSRHYRAIIIAVSIANRSDDADQILGWKLSLPSEHVELAAGAAPPNLLAEFPWWSSPTQDIPANRLIQGTLFFRSRDVLPAVLPHEPLAGHLTAETFQGKKLACAVKVYNFATLQHNPSLDLP
jgi:hypothetical protein